MKNLIRSWILVILVVAFGFQIQLASVQAQEEGDLEEQSYHVHKYADEDTDDDDDDDGGFTAVSGGSNSQQTQQNSGGFNKASGTINSGGGKGGSGGGSGGSGGGGYGGGSGSGGSGSDSGAGTSAPASDVSFGGGSHPNAPAGSKLHPLRQRVLDIALSYVGEIANEGGNPSYYKKGHDLLVHRIYEPAYGMSINAISPGAEEKIRKSGGKFNSWCGIFDTAVCKEAGIETAKWAPSTGGWGPTGLASKAIFGTNGMAPGDIIVIKGDLVHHALLYAINPDGSLDTIDGNSWNQTTGQSQTVGFYSHLQRGNGAGKWKVSDVGYYYKTVDGDVWVPDDSASQANPNKPNP